jgi:hypothetical protein
MRPTLLAVLLALLPTLLLAADPPATTAPLFDDNGTPLTIAQFVGKYIPEAMPEGLSRKEVQAALEDAGANWIEIANGLWNESASKDVQAQSVDGFDPVYLENAVWLLVKAPHLDRLELDYTLLLHVHQFVDAGRTRGFDPRSDLFRRNLLNYRFDTRATSATCPIQSPSSTPAPELSAS